MEFVWKRRIGSHVWRLQEPWCEYLCELGQFKEIVRREESNSKGMQPKKDGGRQHKEPDSSEGHDPNRRLLYDTRRHQCIRLAIWGFASRIFCSLFSWRNHTAYVVIRIKTAPNYVYSVTSKKRPTPPSCAHFPLGDVLVLYCCDKSPDIITIRKEKGWSWFNFRSLVLLVPLLWTSCSIVAGGCGKCGLFTRKQTETQKGWSMSLKSKYIWPNVHPSLKMSVTSQVT